MLEKANTYQQRANDAQPPSTGAHCPHQGVHRSNQTPAPWSAPSSSAAAAVRAMDRVVHDLPPTLHDGAPLKIALTEQGALVRGLREAARARTVKHAARVARSIHHQEQREIETAAKLQARNNKVQQHIQQHREARDAEYAFRSSQHAERARQGEERIVAAARAASKARRGDGDSEHGERSRVAAADAQRHQIQTPAETAAAAQQQLHDVERRRLNQLSFREVDRQLLLCLQNEGGAAPHRAHMNHHHHALEHRLPLSSSTSPTADCLSDLDLDKRGARDTGGLSTHHPANHRFSSGGHGHYGDIAVALRKAEREWTANSSSSSALHHPLIEQPRTSSLSRGALTTPRSRDNSSVAERLMQAQARATASASKLDARRLEEDMYRREVRHHKDAHAAKVQARADDLREARSRQMEQRVAVKKKQQAAARAVDDAHNNKHDDGGATLLNGSRVWATVAVHRARAAALHRQRTAALEQQAAAAGERFVQQMFLLQQP